jgi:iron complex outermembrane receptor protein
MFCRVSVSCLAFILTNCGANAAENPATRTELPTIEVIGTTPLPGIGTPLEQVPGNVQGATGADISRRQALDLTEFLNRSFDSVHINDAQNNPFQPDLSFRGFNASPLLGTPQGLSVFIDGVRVNEAFGDVVNWDLIPRAAISSINLIPGSNPVFGLNTLGGALSIQTKSGFQHPGFVASLTGGMYGRRAAEFEYGGHGQRADYFITANRFRENGWREHSDSSVGQVFAKTGFQDDKTDLDLSLSLADTQMNGTQSLPLSMLGNPRQAYTWPDRTNNQLAFLNLRASRFVRDDVLISGGAHYRKLETTGYFSNVNDEFDPLLPAGPGNATAQNVRNNTAQRTLGLGLQLTFTRKVAGRDNQLSVGASTDTSRVGFTSEAQEAAFNPDRGTAGIGGFLLDTAVGTRNRNTGIYVTDTLSLAHALHLTLSGRYNQTRVVIADQSGVTPALNGSHHFQRFNPSAGLTFNPVPGFTAYTSYNEGMRTPTPVELTCADPAAPCKLPNAFLADPPLKPVIAKTWETGARGAMGNAFKWRASIYRTQLQDDIQFVNSSVTVDSGYFQNTGRTRRQGLELGGEYRTGAFTFSGGYSFIDATYRTPFTLASPNNSSAVDTDSDGNPDTIQVNTGNRIPGIARQLFKLRAEYEWRKESFAGVSLISAAGQHARGDENNNDAQGKVPGYTVVNFDASVTLDRRWRLTAKISNLTNRRYQTFGVLGTNFFRGPNGTFDANNTVPEQFRSSGAPRSAWIGIEYRIEPEKSR